MEYKLLNDAEEVQISLIHKHQLTKRRNRNE